MRQFTPYELNLLNRFGFDPDKAATDFPVDMPVEYITQKAEFRGLIFGVNENVLIPRIETEEMIDLALKNLPSILEFRSSDFESLIFADVGTGSGCIGISFAVELQKMGRNFKGILSDNFNDAVETAINNVQNLLPNSAIEVIKSDLLANYPAVKFDIIFANLPYIPEGRILQNSVQNFEPHSALFGGPDGLNYIREFLKQAKNFLANDGFIILEVDDTHTNSNEFTDWEIKHILDSNPK